MKKQVTFGEQDGDLVQKIQKYQQEKEIKSFTEAVRKLCKAGLSKSVSVKIDL